MDRAAFPLWVCHRATALLLGPLLLVHLVTMIVAVRGGLSAAEILARTQGSAVWGAFYGVTLLATCLHGTIGLRTVVRERTAWRGASLDWAAVGLFAVLLTMGLRALAGVVL